MAVHGNVKRKPQYRHAYTTPHPHPPRHLRPQANPGALPLPSKRLFLENAMRDLSTTLCRGITRQVLATVPLRARLNGRPVVAGLPVPTDDLVPVAGGPS